MIEIRPTLYLDKGAIGFFDLHRLSDHYQICYSEASLFDLLNDHSSMREMELSALNDVGAVYYYRDSDRVLSTQSDAIDLMKKIDVCELQIMVESYRFLNGGGCLNLSKVMHNQLSAILSVDDVNQEIGNQIRISLATNPTLEPLKNHEPDAWRIDLQKATKSWSQKQDITLRSVFDQNPDLHYALKEYFPDTVPHPEQIQLAAMLLGVLQMGSDRGIHSPDDGKSGKAARNGYVDCLHVMFGLHCNIFLTTDKATFRRICLLNDYWQLGRTIGLISKQT